MVLGPDRQPALTRSQNPRQDGDDVVFSETTPRGRLTPWLWIAAAVFFIFEGATSVSRGDEGGIAIGFVVGGLSLVAAISRLLGATRSGLFLIGDRFERRVLGRVVESWPAREVAAVQLWRPGLRLLDIDGHPLVTCDFKHWTEAEVSRFAALTGRRLEPPPRASGVGEGQ
ncbi:MAG: hypothetical protein ACYDGR_13055 [Candidatus Dormibacteria bacterium]